MSQENFGNPYHNHPPFLALITDSDISAEFYGDKYEKKVPKEQWDEKYLEKLSYAVVSESFNKDYLLYLEEVANGVSEKKNSPKVIIGVVVLVVAVVALIVGTLIFNNKIHLCIIRCPSNDKSYRMIPICKCT